MLPRAAFYCENPVSSKGIALSAKSAAGYLGPCTHCQQDRRRPFCLVKRKICSKLAGSRRRNLVTQLSSSLCMSILGQEQWQEHSETPGQPIPSQTGPASIPSGSETGLGPPGARICLFCPFFWLKSLWLFIA